MPDSLYGARLQGFTVVVFIVAKPRAWFDEYIYHDSLQAHAIEGIGHSGSNRAGNFKSAGRAGRFKIASTITP